MKMGMGKNFAIEQINLQISPTKEGTKSTNKQENEMAHEEKLYEKCVQIYEADGQHAVIEYCNKIGHKTWGKCKPCDHDHSPIMGDNFMTCLVCGHSTYHD